jgi:hypothetical protein
MAQNGDAQAVGDRWQHVVQPYVDAQMFGFV